jgi:two-component system sensor histidine kinase KdpD
MSSDAPDVRPDPAALLERLKHEELRRSRGRLKIFFGMAPGVGKTYAMLAAARRRAAEGVDVVVGVVETHGRGETEQLLLGMDLLPRRVVDYKGTALSELDLDAVLRRRPELVLIDELAHTNAPGGRFDKRWRDVEEILAAGIDVYTTLNVQHIESLNDVVRDLVGVEVRETVPDAVVDEADEIELVDLPPDALIDRLKSGRVYRGGTAASALESFFRRRNLAALRELALRRTASWVDARLRDERVDQSARLRLAAAERVVACVSASPRSADVVRAAKRIAAGTGADLLAVNVSIAGGSIGPGDEARSADTMRLAENLGAETALLEVASARDAPAALVRFAQERGAGRIVIGKTDQPRWRSFLRPSFMEEVIRASGPIDVHVVRGEADDLDRPRKGGEPREAERTRRGDRAHPGFTAHVAAAAIVLLITIACQLLLVDLHLANIAMLHLAGVVIAATRLGRGPAVTASVLGVASFDFVFVPPSWTFAVEDLEYLLTFVVMLAVGLLIADRTARLRTLAEHAFARERRSASLSSLARSLAAVDTIEDIALLGARQVREAVGCDAAIVRDDVVIASTLPAGWPEGRDRDVVAWTAANSRPAGWGTSVLPAANVRCIPLGGANGTAAILVVRCGDAPKPPIAARGRLLDAMAQQIGLAIERSQLVEERRTGSVAMATERLRSSLLASVSHDLRTPLTAITGAASTLYEADEGRSEIDPHVRAELVRSILAESTRLADLVANLMFATRLESGAIELRREWTTIEEMVGAGIARFRNELALRPFSLHVPGDLPLVKVDNALMPQVVGNLVENALHYTSAGTPIKIAAWAADRTIVVCIADEGPGIPAAQRSRVFQRFVRIASDDASRPSPGLGLGLTICEGIVRAHGGRIWIESNTPRGTTFLFSLPLEDEQPLLPKEADHVDAEER